MGDALYRGYVYVLKRNIRQRWKLVYCIVYERSIQGVARLEMFRSEDDFWKSRHGQHVRLDDLVYVREITPDLMTAKVHCAFALKSGGKELHFGVPSTMELQQWVASISKAAFKKEPARQGHSTPVMMFDRPDDADYEEPWDLQDIRVEIAENLASKQVGLSGHYDMKIGEKGISVKVSGTTVYAWDFADMSRTGATANAFFFQVRTGDEFEFNSVNADNLLTRLRQFLPLSREIMTAEILARIHCNLNNFYPAVFKVLQTKYWAKTTSLTSIPSVAGTDVSSDVFNSPMTPPHNGFPGVVTRYPIDMGDQRSVVSHDPGSSRRQSSFSRYKSPENYNYEMNQRMERLGSTLSHEQVMGLSDERPPEPSPPLKRLTRIFRRGSKHEKNSYHDGASDYAESDLNSTTDSVGAKKQNWFVRGLLRTSGKKKKKTPPPTFDLEPQPQAFYQTPYQQQPTVPENGSLDSEPTRPGLPRGPPPPVSAKPTPEFYRREFYEQNQDTPTKASALTLTSANVDSVDLNTSDYAPIRKPQRPGYALAPNDEIMERFNEMRKKQNAHQGEIERPMPPAPGQKPVPAPRVSLRQTKQRSQNPQSVNQQDEVRFRQPAEQTRPVVRHSSQEANRNGRRIHPLKELRPNSSTLSTDV